MWIFVIIISLFFEEMTYDLQPKITIFIGELINHLLASQF